MSDEKLEAGDVVYVKSGGPAMTLAWINDKESYCQWFDGNENKGAKFSPKALTKTPPRATPV
jgi:uncharacterized protein YodC (DUF2158 family)